MMIKIATWLAENALLSDHAIRAAIRRYIKSVELQGSAMIEDDFLRAMALRPIAVHPETANAQHYELSPDFFAQFLGPNRKYSCAFYPSGEESLSEAEELALTETVAHADLQNGQSILELGCGWGALTLWIAQRFPASRITAISNSSSQRLEIEALARQRALNNVKVVTADMNDFEAGATFDRIVSVEMFEHMANWRPLLTRIRDWLRPDGLLFLHVFTHYCRPSYYDPADCDWMSRHFFSGGIMPSQTLIHHFSDLFTVNKEWRWNGMHYRRTAEHWLENFDAKRRDLNPILEMTYGTNAALWRQRWRMFMLATAESFGYRDGAVQGVCHYQLAPVHP